MLLYYDYISLVLCLVIVSCSSCPCNSKVLSQNEAIALKCLDIYKIISLVLLFFLCFRATGVLLMEKTYVLSVIYVLTIVIALFLQNTSTNIFKRNVQKQIHCRRSC